MQKTLVIGVDPGDTTGYAMFEFSDPDCDLAGEDGPYGWDGDALGTVPLKKRGFLDLISMKEIEHIWGFDWWKEAGNAGGELAEMAYSDISSWLNGVPFDQYDGNGNVLIVMEDYIPSPAKAKAGAFDRSSVSPVAVGSVFWAELMAMTGSDANSRVRYVISSPSMKSMIDVRKHYVFRALKAQGVRIVVDSHSGDALKHAYLAFR